MTPTTELIRAGLVETSPGVFEKVNDARRTVSKVTAIGADPHRHPGPAVEEAQDAAEVSQLPHSEHQELQDVDYDGEGSSLEASDVDLEAGVPGMEREGRSRFRIAVALRVSNYGRRDPTGAIETLCDLLTATRRRLSERLAARQLDSRVSFARKRGRDNHPRKTVTVTENKRGPVPF